MQNHSKILEWKTLDIPLDKEKRRNITHAFIQEYVAQHTKAPIANLKVAHNEWGKPFLNSPIHFNISYSHHLAFIGFSHSYIGVDVEKIDPNFDFQSVLQNFFTQSERDQLNQIPSNIQPFAFYRAWTCKEAFVKAIGKGVSFPLENCEVEINPALPSALIAFNGSRTQASAWQMLSYTPTLGYIASICVKK